MESKIPREAVKIMSGFSEEVAMAVTHPLWPDKEPRNLSDSAILKVCWTTEQNLNGMRDSVCV